MIMNVFYILYTKDSLVYQLLVLFHYALLQMQGFFWEINLTMLNLYDTTCFGEHFNVHLIRL